jgi:two-component system response regulator AtoC
MVLRVLAAGREPGVLEALEVAVAGAGYEVFCAATPGAAHELARNLAPDAILWSPGGGFDDEALSALLRRVPAAYAVAAAPGAAPGSSRPPVRFCHDALTLPCDEPSLRLILHRAVSWGRLQREVRLLRREVEHGAGDRPIVAASAPMIDLLEALERAAGLRSCVLLCGEHGTGKEGLARAIHAQSPRRSGPFVALSCLEAEPAGVAAALLGRAPAEGAVEPGCLRDAAGGTLFLDHVDALPADGRAVLLHFLETGEVVRSGGAKPSRVDARVIAATARDLRASVSAGLFPEALLERLAASELRVPPLRERPEDIPLLLDHFVARAGRGLGRTPPALADDALERLVGYPWPGNVRELESVVDRAVRLARGERISARQLPELLAAGDESSDGELGLRRARKRLEVELIRRALRRTGGNRTHAARLLEISHRALLYKLKEHGIGG